MTLNPRTNTGPTPEQEVFWFFKIENSIRYFHPNYRKLSEEELKMVPKEFWYPDPIHLLKLK